MPLGTGADAAARAASLPNYLQPTQGKGLYAGNYLDFTNESIDQWAQQFLPDVYDKEIEIYGNRTISGFLKMVSAEMPSTSDQIIWLEQGRLHTRYTGLTVGTALTTVTGGAGQAITFEAGTTTGLPENFTSTTEGRTGTTNRRSGNNIINFRIGQTVMIQQESNDGNIAKSVSRGVGNTAKGIVTDVAADGSDFEVTLYTALGAPTAVENSGTITYTALAYGSEFAKGTGNFTEKLDPSYSTYANAPIIMKEHYSINGSDTGQIGWIEVTSENGASGYLWYVKAEHENRLRWEDYIEMAMVEGVTQADTTTGGALGSFRGDFGNTGASGQTARGTEGFFAALTDRGNIYTSLADDLNEDARSGLSATRTSTVQSFDNILRQLDRQGSIEENMLYTNRDLALAFDNMLSGVNSNANATGTSYGLFNNSESMALNLGFNGFRRGSYDFYKTDWKYLNDYSTRGGFGDIEGVMIPAGTSTVYDQNLGKNIKRPFLHVRYRASETDNRKMKSWITGSVGGAYTTDVDEMRMHYLTERCLITQGANNFFLFQ